MENLWPNKPASESDVFDLGPAISCKDLAYKPPWKPKPCENLFSYPNIELIPPILPTNWGRAVDKAPTTELERIAIARAAEAAGRVHDQQMAAA